MTTDRKIDSALIANFITAGKALLADILDKLTPSEAAYINDLTDKGILIGAEMILTSEGRKAVVMFGLDCVGQQRALFQCCDTIKVSPAWGGFGGVPGADGRWMQ